MNWASQNRKCLEDAREKAEGSGFPGHTQKYTDENIQSVVVIQLGGLSCPAGKLPGMQGG